MGVKGRTWPQRGAECPGVARRQGGRPLRVTDPEADREARGSLLRDPSGISGQRGKGSFTSLGTADRLLGIKRLQCNFL